MIEETQPIKTGEQQDWNGVLDPKMKRVWDYYVKPSSPTFNNAKQSALRAGYAMSYAMRITGVDWFKAKVRKLNMLGKAEKALEKALDMVTTNEEGKEQADLIRVQTDVAKFIAKTLGKDDGYTERNEITGRDGQGIVFMPVELMDKYKLPTGTQEEVEEVTKN